MVSSTASPQPLTITQPRAKSGLQHILWIDVLRGSAWAGLISGALLTGWLGWIAGPTLLLRVLGSAIFGLAAILYILLYDGVITLLRVIAKIVLKRFHASRAVAWLDAMPAELIGRTLGGLMFALGSILFPDTIFSTMSAGAVDGLIMLICIASGALIGLTWHIYRRPNEHIAFGSLSIVPLLLLIAWLVWPGSDGGLLQPDAAIIVEALSLPNPGIDGSYPVSTLTYGSGTDRLRAPYGKEADLITPTVNGAPIWAGFGGIGQRYTDWMWDFDTTALPLNAQVWLPEDDGPFPLVLIVHGNHLAVEYSEEGYTYLAEHLASHGYIVASIDQNFLNGLVVLDGNNIEMPLRAWMLLKHLEQWRAWNSDPSNLLYGKVDMDHIALIGHSRGGEAASLAADMNTRVYHLISKVSELEDFGFGIRAVVSIAPSDAKYKPNGRPLVLKDISFMTIEGAHDADTNVFYGLAQYGRTEFSGDVPEAFKAAVYLYRANHGQFNSVWQYGDLGRRDWLLLNREALLTMEEQQLAAKTVITAFLNAALLGEDGYREVFIQPAAARDWLPDDLIVTQYQDASFIPIDVNSRPARTGREIDAEGGQASAEDLSQWIVVNLQLRTNEHSQNNSAMLATWEADHSPSVTYSLPLQTVSDWDISPSDSLTFLIGSARDTYTPRNIRIVVTTADGIEAVLSLDEAAVISPPLIPRTFKSDVLSEILHLDFGWEWQAEQIMQVVDMPIEAFQAVTQGLSASRITQIRFEFDGSTEGAIYLDEVGYRRGIQP